MKKFIALLLLAGLAQSAHAVDVGSAESVKLKFYDFWVSPNADCTGLTRVFNDPSPAYQDVVTGPTFGTPVIANGTYNCVAWKMTDIIKLTPDYTSTGSGACVQGVESSKDLFRGGDVSITPTGATINGSGTVGSPIENNMYIYLSVNGDNNNSANTPSAPGKINAPYIVGGDSAATFVFDFTNGIEDVGGGVCSPEGVSFRFRY